MTGDEQFPFRDELRKALLEAIDRDQHDASQPRVAPRHARWGIRIPLFGAAAAALLAVVLLGVQMLAPSGSASEVDTVLAALQRVALTTPVPAVDSSYVYAKVASYVEVTTASVSGDVSYRALVPTILERWIAADGTGRQRTTLSGAPPIFAHGTDRAAWEADGSPALVRERDVVIEPGDLSIGRLRAEQVLALPTDSRLLRAELAKLVQSSDIAGNGSLAYDMLEVVVSGLLWLNPPPELRAALFGALGDQPGIEVQRGVVDELGRPGVALWVRERGVRTELVVDPSTAQILAVNAIVEDSDVSNRQLMGRRTLIQTGVVEGTTETP